MNKKDKDRFYYDKNFLGSPDARSVRILSEYYGPLQRIKRNKIQDFLVFDLQEFKAKSKRKQL